MEDEERHEEEDDDVRVHIVIDDHDDYYEKEIRKRDNIALGTVLVVAVGCFLAGVIVGKSD